MRPVPSPWPNPMAIAKALIAAHPALLSLDSRAAEIVADTIAGAPGLTALATAISAQGSAKPDSGWAHVREVGDVGFVRATVYALTKLTLDAAEPVAAAVIQATQSDPDLRDLLWFETPGNVGGYHAIAPRAGFDWEIAAFPAGYGLVVPRLRYAVADRRFQIELENLAPRAYAVYVEFIDANGSLVEPTSWESRLPAGIATRFEDATCKYLNLLPPTRRIEGIPMPTLARMIEFELPPLAMQARLILGGLGAPQWSALVGALGGVTSSILGYAVPTLLVQSGTPSGDWYAAMYEPGPLLQQVVQAGAPLLDQISLAAAYDWLTEQTGELLYGDQLPALKALLIETLGAAAFVEAAPTLGWATALLARTNASKSAFTGSVLSAPSAIAMLLSPGLVGSVSVAISADPARGAWPADASAAQVVAHWSDGSSSASAEIAGLTNATETVVELTDVPANRALEIAVSVSDASARVLATATSRIRALFSPRQATAVLTEDVPTIDAQTRWEFAWTLGWDAAQGHHWQAGPQPRSTLRDLDGSSGGHHLAALIGLQLCANGHALSYAWQASGQGLPICGASMPTNAQVYGFQTLSALADPQSALVFPSCAFTAQPNIAFDATDCAGGYFLDPRDGVSRLRRFQLGEAFDLRATAPSCGQFVSAHLSDLLIHPAGYALGLSYAENAFMNLPLATLDQESPERVAGRSGGAGTEPGRFGGPVALSLSPSGQVLVLEAINARIQAVDVYGNPVGYFNGDACLALPAQSQAVTYLDLAVDHAGYLYVLLYLGQGDAPADYRVDVHAPDGRYLSTSVGVNAARIAVDRWRNLYTLNYESFPGPGQRTEPGISVYIPKIA